MTAEHAATPDFAAMSAAELNDWYEQHVGYRPQEDCPTMTEEELRDACKSYAAELKLQAGDSNDEA